MRLTVRALGAVAFVALVAGSPPFGATLARAAAPLMANVPALDPADLDMTGKACTDFYAFATGGWSKTHPLPAGRARWGGFDELALHNRELALHNRDVPHTILDADAAATTAPAGGDVQKLGSFYRACMDTGAIRVQGVRTHRAGEGPSADRRLHARAALLLGLRAGVALGRDRRVHPADRGDQRAPVGQVPRARYAVEHAGVRGRVPLRRGRQDGARRAVPDLVGGRSEPSE
jgi:hypothetical protein